MAAKLLTRKEIAREHGISVKTVSRWEADGMDPDEPGRGGVASRWKSSTVERWRKKKLADHTAGVETAAASRQRRDAAQAKLSEQLYAQRAGELIPADEVERVWRAHVLAVRQQIIGTYSKQARRLYVAARADGGLPAFREELKAVAHELLVDLSGIGGEAA